MTRLFISVAGKTGNGKEDAVRVALMPTAVRYDIRVLKAAVVTLAIDGGMTIARCRRSASNASDPRWTILEEPERSTSLQETFMPSLIALAVSIGVLATAATWLFLGPLAAMLMQIWQAFIAWACFFHSGGDLDGFKRTVICMSFGAVVGALSVLLAGHLAMLHAFAAPVAVGVGASVIVLAAHLGFLGTIPASVYGFAAIAGLILLKGVAPLDAVVPTVLSITVGAVFGLVSARLAALLTKPATVSGAKA